MTDQSQTSKPVRGNRTSSEAPRRASRRTGDDPMSKLITVDFHDDTLFAVETPEGVFVAIKPISDGLGLKWSGQHDRLKRSPILAEGIRVLRMPSIGGEQETTCLRLELLQGWLFGINPGQVRAEVRDRVLSYQRECYAALHSHFYGRKAPGPAPLPEAILKRLRMVTECRQSHGIKAAQEMWRKLDLPTVPAMSAQPAQSAMPFTFGDQGGK